MENNVINPLDDFFSSKVMLISFISAIVTIILISFILYIAMGSIDDVWNIFPSVVNDYIHLINSTLEKYGILSFFIEHKILMWLIHIINYMGIGIFFYYLFFILYSFVIGVFNTYFVVFLQKKYYGEVELKGMSSLSTTIFYIKTIAVMLTLFVIFSPLYLIPVLNITIFIPMYYFFHKTIIFDVSSVINSKKELISIKKANRLELKTKTLFCFCISLIPVIGVLMYPYFLFVIGNLLFTETKDLRYVKSFQDIE
jgi:hypothetical protein